MGPQNKGEESRQLGKDACLGDGMEESTGRVWESGQCKVLRLALVVGEQGVTREKAGEMGVAGPWRPGEDA